MLAVAATVAVMKVSAVLLVATVAQFACSTHSSGPSASSGASGGSAAGGSDAPANAGSSGAPASDTSGAGGASGRAASADAAMDTTPPVIGDAGQVDVAVAVAPPESGAPATSCRGSATPAATPPACQSTPADYANPFQDPCRPLEDRITNLLALLTVGEKQTLLGSNHPAIARLGLPQGALGVEGLHGLAIAGDPANIVPTNISTQFPQAFGLGEAWDPEVTKTVGATMGYEARVYNARGVSPTTGRLIGLVVRAPNVDLARDPRWGRTEESYGEDPYLIGELAKGLIAGLQGPDPKYLLTASMLKHFAANSNENTRTTSSSNLDERNLREYYTATFATAVREGRAQAIMTAYNKINTVPAAVSPLLQSLVIGTWGFQGFFCTDGSAPSLLTPPTQSYFATLEQSVAAVVKGGTGMLLQGNATLPLSTTVANAFTMGLLTVNDVDAALRSVLRARFRLGEFDPPDAVPHKKILGTEAPWESAESKAKVLDVTRKTIVLLKNANRTLPLDRTALRTVAVIGPRADSVLRDWYGGMAPYLVTPRQGITSKLGPGVTVRFAADNTANAATSAAAASDVALVFVGNHPTCGDTPVPPWGTCPSQYEGREQVDRVSIALEPLQLALVQAVAAANPRTIVVLVSSFPQGIAAIQASASVPSILHVTNSSQELGTAIADVLFGDYNPAGRTTTTWYASEADIPTLLTDYDIKKGTTYWYYAGTPLFPFGYGLSYASFTYANLTVSRPSISAAPAPGSCGSVEVGLDIVNSGTVAGDEVVQLYVAYPGSAITSRPRQQLRGFRRVNVAPGATAHVTFDIAGADLAYFDATTSAFALEVGKAVELQVGASSRDIRLRAMLTVAP